MATWESLVAFATTLPESLAAHWYGTPAVKVRDKGFLRLRDEGDIVLMCSLDEKEALLASGDLAFHTTAHYDSYGAILVDLPTIDDAQLHELVTAAWRLKAPATLRKQFDA